jgi:hypothetical protein
MKRSIFFLWALCVFFASGSVRAQTSGWQPSAEHTQLSIWPGAVPDAQPVAGPEVAKTTGDSEMIRTELANRQSARNLRRRSFYHAKNLASGNRSLRNSFYVKP